MKNKIIAQDKQNLKLLIKEALILYGNACDLNHIDTANITDMSYLFDESQFNGDISGWNVGNVTTMECMFWFSQFNGDISKWNVSNVENMSSMFSNSQFNRNISHWNLIKVTDIRGIFNRCPCEKPWWAIEDNDLRKEIIEKYQLMQQLEKKLIQKDMTQPKKIKI